MNETIAISMIISIPPLIVAVATLVVGIRNSAKATKIHTLVDGNLSKVQEQLKMAIERVTGLENLIAKISNGRRKDVP